MISVGDVIYNNGMKMVVIDFKNHEDAGSCSYSREYKLCLLEELEGKDIIDLSPSSTLGYWVKVTGSKFPDIEMVEGIAPFVIEKVLYAKVRQKKAKTVTVYE